MLIYHAIYHLDNDQNNPLLFKDFDDAQNYLNERCDRLFGHIESWKDRYSWINNADDLFVREKNLKWQLLDVMHPETILATILTCEVIEKQMGKHKKSKKKFMRKLYREINAAMFQYAPFYMGEDALNDWLYNYDLGIIHGSQKWFVIDTADDDAIIHKKIFENYSYIAVLEYALNAAKEKIIHKAVDDYLKFNKVAKTKRVNLI